MTSSRRGRRLPGRSGLHKFPNLTIRHRHPPRSGLHTIQNLTIRTRQRFSAARPNNTQTTAAPSVLPAAVPTTVVVPGPDSSSSSSSAGSNLEDKLGVVAWLVPFWGLALTAIEPVLQAMFEDPSKYAQQWKMIEAFFDVESWSTDPSKVDSAPTELHARSLRPCQPSSGDGKHYAFKLALYKSMLEQLFRYGWWLGTLGPDIGEQEIDFLVAVDGASNFPPHRYANFLIDPRSGQIKLQAHWPTTIINGNRKPKGFRLQNMESIVLINDDIILTEDCGYKFEYAHAYYQPGILAETIQRHMQQSHPNWPINQTLLATTPRDIQLAGPFAFSVANARYGQHTESFGGWGKEGQAVTVERIRNPWAYDKADYLAVLEKFAMA